jgi:hypothetical protein
LYRYKATPEHRAERSEVYKAAGKLMGHRPTISKTGAVLPNLEVSSTSWFLGVVDHPAAYVDADATDAADAALAALKKRRR